MNHFNEVLVVHRKRTPYAEVDLLFSRPQKLDRDPLLTLIEVKSVLSDGIWGENVISSRQLKRLGRARTFLEIRYRVPVRLVIATVQSPWSRTHLQIRYFQVAGDDNS